MPLNIMQCLLVYAVLVTFVVSGIFDILVYVILLTFVVFGISDASVHMMVSYVAKVYFLCMQKL